MSAIATARPEKTEYAAYYEGYISRVPDGEIIAILRRQMDETLSVLRGIPEDRGDYRYADGKWSIKELVGHITDSERVFAYRALRFGRGDTTPLSGFEQDDFVRGGNFSKRTVADLAEEYENVRKSTISLLARLDAEAFSRRGSANNNEVSVKGLAYIIAGHELHHIDILRSRYL